MTEETHQVVWSMTEETHQVIGSMTEETHQVIWSMTEETHQVIWSMTGESVRPGVDNEGGVHSSPLNFHLKRIADFNNLHIYIKYIHSMHTYSSIFVHILTHEFYRKVYSNS